MAEAMSADQLELSLGCLMAHCFACAHVEYGADPQAVHDAMERHYSAQHRALIDRLTHFDSLGERPERRR